MASLGRLQLLGLVQKVCEELDSHLGFSDKDLAEFIIHLADEHSEGASFTRVLGENGAEFPRTFSDNLLRIIQRVRAPPPSNQYSLCEVIIGAMDRDREATVVVAPSELESTGTIASRGSNPVPMVRTSRKPHVTVEPRTGVGPSGSRMVTSVRSPATNTLSFRYSCSVIRSAAPLLPTSVAVTVE